MIKERYTVIEGRFLPDKNEMHCKMHEVPTGRGDASTARMHTGCPE